MSKLLHYLPKRILRHEDSIIGVAVAWLLGVPLAVLAGFYLGTIVGHPWGLEPSYDYRPPDMANGAIGALIGLGVGVLIAIVVTVLYPTVVAADEMAALGHHDDVVID